MEAKYCTKPEGFEYCVCCDRHNDGTLYSRISDQNRSDFLGNIDSPTSSEGVIFTPGLNKIRGIEVFVVQDQERYIFFWFRNRKDAEALETDLKSKAIEIELKVENPVYKFKRGSWVLVENFEARNSDDLIGHHDELDLVAKDISNSKLYEPELHKIGEAYKSLNYILYGPPGTGKTTFVRTIATRLKLPIYIVNAAAINATTDIETILNPKRHCDCILLFEDFDRYLGLNTHNMSKLLNGLDGITTSRGCVKFFTANNMAVVEKHKALNNRMVGRFLFDYPNRNDFVCKFMRFLTLKDEKSQPDPKQKNKFFDKVSTIKGLTLRPFTNYVIRYIFEKDYMDILIKKIAELGEDNSVPVKSEPSKQSKEAANYDYSFE